jgi:Flp pilus assembly protein TadB
LPAETGPLAVWWVLPAVAAVLALVALLLGHRLWSSALVLVAALELAVWVFIRRDAAFRALIPTDAPFWLDRSVMAASAVVAVVAAVSAAVAMYRLPR